ncbi:MAG TPA: hypothetical protein VGU46_02900 [Acidobacteriaceae bacterium]|nr:hypothetical protein [Acidobacteriaceae bacterium]
MEMTDMDRNDGTTRDELVQRIALMEAMIAEGRQSTGRAGWIFVMWGVLYFAATGWVCYLPLRNWAWPVCMTTGMVVLASWQSRQRRAGAVRGPKSQTISAVWWTTGLAVSLFAVFGGITRHGEHTFALYLAAIVFFIGLAHAISAAILQWTMQGMVAAVWWGGGIAILFAPSPVAMLKIFLTATFFGQIVFGLYAMSLQRQRAVAERVMRHG